MKMKNNFIDNQIQVGGPNDCPAATTTISNSEYNFSSPAAYGWVCPKCRRVYSPSTEMCLYCGGNTNVIPITVGNKTFPDDWLIYHVTDPLKEPEIHLDKDWKNKEFFVDYNKPNVSY